MRRKGPRKSALEMEDTSDEDGSSGSMNMMMSRKNRCSTASIILVIALTIAVCVMVMSVSLPAYLKGRNPISSATPSSTTTTTSTTIPSSSPTSSPTTEMSTSKQPATRVQLPPSGVDADVLMQIIKNVSLVRPPDSPNIRKVRSFLKSCFDSETWTVEEDSFEAQAPVPLGKKMMSNIIATLKGSSEAKKRLILSAHYDSKWYPDPNQFEGATDSAAPCGIMCYIAKYHFGAGNSVDVHKNVTLQMVFFDGEEAFVDWSETDSLYGARHLAAKWEEENNLATIEPLVLLDLLGSADTSVQPLSQRTASYYEKILQIQADLITGNLTQKKKKYFQSFPQWHVSEDPYTVQDDHIPFLRRGVPVVHLISNPFPRVWHTVRDNFAALDSAVCHDLTAILWRFLKRALN